MFLRVAISTLRAAHGLAFAMAAGQKPDPVDLDAAGLGGVPSELFGNHIERENPLYTKMPKAASGDTPSTIPAPWNSSPATGAA
jgi:hypothetical protein